MPHSNEIALDFSGLAVWDHFINTSQATPENITMVKAHIEFARPLLDLYNDTFPKYTLHNIRHQKNIIKLMGDLLGEDVLKLSTLEAAMLVLSAIYHDIGMVYKKSEIEKITNESEFTIFLDQNTKAKLQYEENDRKPTDELIEWYCRWMHAKRVWVYLNSSSAPSFQWGNISIKEKLGYLCESHNFSVQEIITDLDTFNNDYLGKCDLVFCTVILRLADILDFDNSRSPKSVYEFLDLGNPKNASDSYSKIEWEKHLNSNGFEFKREQGNLKLMFSATTQHPNIEIAIRNFIQTINFELASCQKLQKFCSPKWQGYVLPSEVNVDNLTSENYQSGHYHFSLSQDKILTLLAGDGLYNDDFIFIRELIQNAIDTSRHREFRERISNPSFKSDPIKVSFFTDIDGYQWIRIDDYGMGMDENIITNHLLKKGESYYNSDKFKLEKINISRATEKDFVPISRFGIGLLSCFIAGDRIEISTKHYSQNSSQLRLGIEGRNGSYVFQSSEKKHIPRIMPTQFTPNEGYRNEIGTSIAVRITTNKEFAGFDMRTELERFIICSPIPILFDGSLIGGDQESLLNKPWSTDEIFQIDPEFALAVEKTFDIEFKDGIKINLENIDITKSSFNENLKGQLVILAVQAEYNRKFTSQKTKPSFSLRRIGKKLELEVHSKEKIEGKEVNISEKIDISYISDKLNIPTKLGLNHYRGDHEPTMEGIHLSHNGIVLYDEKGLLKLDYDRINSAYSYSGYNNSSFIHFGIFYFQDKLLPQLTISRNEIKTLPFELVADLSFSLEPLNKYIEFEDRKFCFFRREGRRDYYTSFDVEDSGFYRKNKIFLNEYIKLDTIKGMMSVDQINKDITDKIQFHPQVGISPFYDTLVNFVTEQNFHISKLFGESSRYNKYYLHKKNTVFPKELQHFPPLTFIQFDNNAEKLSIGEKLNINHPYITWYIKVAELLRKEYFYYSKQLIYSTTAGNIVGDVERINKILHRLNVVLPEEYKPYKTVSITKSDFK